MCIVQLTNHRAWISARKICFILWWCFYCIVCPANSIDKSRIGGNCYKLHFNVCLYIHATGKLNIRPWQVADGSHHLRNDEAQWGQLHPSPVNQCRFVRSCAQKSKICLSSELERNSMIPWKGSLKGPWLSEMADKSRIISIKKITVSSDDSLPLYLSASIDVTYTQGYILVPTLIFH